MVVTGLTDFMYAGNAREIEFTITDEDNNDVALDVTNYRIKWAISNLASDGTFSTTPVLSKDSDNVGEIDKLDAPNGVVQVNLDPADTATLGGRTFYMELEAFDPSGDPVVVATGTLEIRRNVANP